MSEFRRRLIAQVANDPNALPAGCVELEYLRGTGTQWILTDYIPKIGDSIYLQFMVDTLNYDMPIFMAKTKEIIGATMFSRKFYFSVFETLSENIQIETGKMIPMKIDSDGTVFINGNSYKRTITGDNVSQLYLFARPDKTDKLKGAIGQFIIVRDGVEQLHLIPCLNLNGEPCMYDTVAKNFHYNKGTGKFLHP